MLNPIKVDLDLEIFGFMAKSFQIITEIHYINDYLFFFAVNKEISQFLNGIEENIEWMKIEIK